MNLCSKQQPGREETEQGQRLVTGERGTGPYDGAGQEVNLDNFEEIVRIRLVAGHLQARVLRLVFVKGNSL